MSMGLRMWNSSGNLTYDTNDRILKSIITTTYTATNNPDDYNRYPYVGGISALTYLGGYHWNDAGNYMQQMQGGVLLPVWGTGITNSVPAAVDADFSGLCHGGCRFVFVYSLNISSYTLANTDLYGFITDVRYQKTLAGNYQQSILKIGYTKFYNGSIYIAITVDPGYYGNNGYSNDYGFTLQISRY